MSLSSESVALKICLEKIASHTESRFVVPELAVEPDSKVLQEILSKVLQNDKISYLDLNIFSKKSLLTEYINSDKGKAFLCDLIKKHTKSMNYITNLLSSLKYGVGLTPENIEWLEGELTLWAASGVGRERNLTTNLNLFSKNPEKLKLLAEALNQAQHDCNYYFTLDVSELRACIPQISSFFSQIHRVEGDNTIIICIKDGRTESEEPSQAIALLASIKPVKIDRLSLSCFGQDGLSFEALKSLVQRVAETSWIKHLAIQSPSLTTLTDEQLLDVMSCFSKRKINLDLFYNGFKSYCIKHPDFLPKMLEMPGINSLCLWWSSEDSEKVWTPEERQALIDCNLKLISAQRTGYEHGSPFSSLISSPEEEFKVLCKAIINAPWRRDLYPRIAELASKIEVSEMELINLAETVFESEDDLGILTQLKFTREQRLKFFLKFANENITCSFADSHPTSSDDISDYYLGISDVQFPGSPFIDAWKGMQSINAPLVVEGEIDFNPEQLKTECVGKLMPALKLASEAVWKDNKFYKSCFSQLEKRLAEIKTEDVFVMLRFVQLLQWYTWLMSNLSTLKDALSDDTLAALSPVLKELVGYADRGMRYKLSKALLRVLAEPAGQALYGGLIKKDEQSGQKSGEKALGSQLIKKGRQAEGQKAKKVVLYLPEILLIGIILNIFPEQSKAKDGKELKESVEQIQQRELLKIVQDICGLLSHKYENGHHLRTLMTGIYALSQEKTLSAKEKLVLIKSLLVASIESYHLAKPVETFFSEKLKTLTGEASISASALKAELVKLLGKQSEEILPYFEKYFKHPSKMLKRKDLRPLSRGVLEKVNQLEDEQAFRKQMSNWLLIGGLSELGEIAALSAKAPEQYEDTLHALLRKIFKLEAGELGFYQSTFSGQRNETATLTYLAGIRRLKSSERRELEQRFQDTIKDLSTEAQTMFYQKRYDVEKHEHLRVIFSARPALSRLWPQNQSENFNDFIAKHGIKFRPFEPDYTKFLLNKIRDNRHLNLEHYPQLKQYLDDIDDDSIKEAIKAKLERELKDLLEKSKDSDKKPEWRLKLQLALIRLAESSKSGKLDIKETAEAAEAAQKLVQNQRKWVFEASSFLQRIRENDELRNDLEVLYKNFDSAKTPLDLLQSAKWQIVVTDHYWDLFMSGTDVEGSCQRVDGDPTLNRCLAAYLKDGKIKMIAIKDETGKIVARCILRLLWDEKNKTPVLYLEEHYPAFLRSEPVQVIEQFAIHLAEDLNLTLVSASSTETSIRYPNPLASLSGFGPEYVDAIHQPSEEGVFEIPSAQILFDAQGSKGMMSGKTPYFSWSEDVVSGIPVGQDTLLFSYTRPPKKKRSLVGQCCGETVGKRRVEDWEVAQQAALTFTKVPVAAPFAALSSTTSMDPSLREMLELEERIRLDHGS